MRLPDELAAFVDDEVRSGRAASRAAVIARALERERRHELERRDIEILAHRDVGSDDLDQIATYAASVRSDLR